MPAPYSNDLREKVLAAINRGEKKSRVIELFGVSRDSIDRWLKQRQQEGHAGAKRCYQQGHSHHITDWNAFRAFAREHGDKTQADMAQLWSTPTSASTMSRGLKHIGFTRKKRRTATINATSSNGSSF